MRHSYQAAVGHVLEKLGSRVLEVSVASSERVSRSADHVTIQLGEPVVRKVLRTHTLSAHINLL
jgi:hypothetical protein